MKPLDNPRIIDLSKFNDRSVFYRIWHHIQGIHDFGDILCISRNGTPTGEIILVKTNGGAVSV